MALKPVLSMIGLEEWYSHEHEGDSIFKDMSLPDTVDRETLANNIMLETADFTVLYTDPDFMKRAIDMWSTKMMVKWQKLADALELQYNPLENYRRNELEAGSVSRTNESNRNTSSSRNNETSSEDESTTNTSNILSTTEEANALNKVNGMNSPTELTLTEHDQQDTSRQGASRSAGTEGEKSKTKAVGSEVAGATEKENKLEGEKNNRSSLVYGNIGVTTSQQMLESELAIRSNWNMYDIITNDFKNQFCILVY